MSDKTPNVRYDAETGQLVSLGPICADKDDQIVPCDSPAANTQVAGAGTPIPPKVAKRYGLAKAAGKPEAEQLPAEEAKPKVLGEAEREEPAVKERSLSSPKSQK